MSNEQVTSIWEVSKFAEKYGQKPERERDFFSAVFCHPDADWKSISPYLPKTINVSTVLEALQNMLHGRGYYSGGTETYSKEVYAQLIMPLVESLGLLANTDNEFFFIAAEIVRLSESMSPVVRYGLDGMEIVLRYPSNPSAWDDKGNRPFRTGFSVQQCLSTNLFTDEEQRRLIESARIVETALGEGALHKLARWLVKRKAVSEAVLDQYRAELVTVYRGPDGHRSNEEDAAKFAATDEVLNAFCLAMVGRYGAVSAFDAYRQEHPSIFEPEL
jgi:hypothetical protein